MGAGGTGGSGVPGLPNPLSLVATTIAAGAGALVSAAKGLYDLVRGKGATPTPTVGKPPGKPATPTAPGAPTTGTTTPPPATGGSVKAAGGKLEKLKNITSKGIGFASKLLAPLAVGMTAYGAISEEAEGKHIDNIGDVIPEGFNAFNPLEWASNASRYAGNKINKGVEAVTGGNSIGSMTYDLFNDTPDVTAPVVIPPAEIARRKAHKANMTAMSNAVSVAKGGGGGGGGKVNPPSVRGSDGETSGPSEGNADLMSLVTVSPNVDLEGLTGQTTDRLTSLANDYYDATGKKLKINSGARTYEKQAQLYADYKAGKPGANPANPPGTSLDATPAQVDEMDKLGLLRKNGFERIAGPKEKQHIQLAGSQEAIGSSGRISGDAVGAPKIGVAAGSTVTASAPAESVVNNKISVPRSDSEDSGGGADVIQGPTYQGGAGGGRGSGGGRGTEPISVASVPTFMFNDPAFYATNVQAMA